MIRVYLDTEALTLEMNGHADYADAGQDIVCAAASMLAYTLLERARELHAEVHASIDGGRLSLRCGAVMANHPLLWAAFETVRAGFSLLARKYPEHVVLAGGDSYGEASNCDNIRAQGRPLTDR